MSADRLQEKNELLLKLGMLAGPIRKLIENPDDYDEQERAEVIAQFEADRQALRSSFGKFCYTQPGHIYPEAESKFILALLNMRDAVTSTKEGRAERVMDHLLSAQAAIAEIPIPRSSIILDAHTPFSTYCRLKALCTTDATQDVVWIDAYLDDTIFTRYLRDIANSVTVTLVTTAPRPNANRRDRDRWNAFVDISRLYADERGATHYRLIVHQGLLHDRWVLFDSKRLYGLGGSVKDAGNKQYFTLTRLDSTQHNLNAIQTHIQTGTEYFGPNTPKHK